MDIKNDNVKEFAANDSDTLRRGSFADNGPCADKPANDAGGEPPKGDGAITRVLRTVHMAVFVTAIILMTPVCCALIFSSVIFSRRLARLFGRMWNRAVLLLGGVGLNVSGLEKLDKNERYVFMSNHQSALDIPIIYAGMHENICFIAKKELFKIPVFGWCMSAMGHVSIDRENARKAHASIIRAVEKLNRDNVSLILFPEGTRSKDGKVLEFKTASFSLALQAGVKLVPVAIRGAIERLPPKSSKIVPGKVTLEIGDPIDIAALKSMSKSDICSMVHKEIKRMVEGE